MFNNIHCCLKRPLRYDTTAHYEQLHLSTEPDTFKYSSYMHAICMCVWVTGACHREPIGACGSSLLHPSPKTKSPGLLTHLRHQRAVFLNRITSPGLARDVFGRLTVSWRPFAYAVGEHRHNSNPRLKFFGDTCMNWHKLWANHLLSLLCNLDKKQQYNLLNITFMLFTCAKPLPWTQEHQGLPANLTTKLLYGLIYSGRLL